MECSGNTESKTENNFLKPGQLVKPVINLSTAKNLVEQLYGLEIRSFEELPGYHDRNYLVKVDNPKLDHCNGLDIGLPVGANCFVFKILNSLESLKTHVDAEHEITNILFTGGFNCPLSVPNLTGQEKSLEWIDYYDDNSHDDKQSAMLLGGFHLVRLLTYIPGRMFAEVTYTPKLLYQVGKNLGALDTAIEGFHHPALDVYKTLWSLECIPHLRNFIYAVTDPDNRRLAEQVIEQFEVDVTPKLHLCKRGVIHGDFNHQNIIVAETRGSDALEGEKYQLSGIIDFGHVQDSYYVFELGIAIMYMTLDSTIVDPMEVGGHVLAGYLNERSLNSDEFSVLRTCTLARFAQSLVMGAYSHSMDPTNEYLLMTAENGWSRMKLIWNLTDQELYDVWKRVIVGYQNID